MTSGTEEEEDWDKRMDCWRMCGIFLVASRSPPGRTAFHLPPHTFLHSRIRTPDRGLAVSDLLLEDIKPFVMKFRTEKGASVSWPPNIPLRGLKLCSDSPSKKVEGLGVIPPFSFIPKIRAASTCLLLEEGNYFLEGDCVPESH